jgi:hypothetical protein
MGLRNMNKAFKNYGERIQEKDSELSIGMPCWIKEK